MFAGDPGPFLFVAACEVLFFLPQRSRVQKALHAADGPARDLDVLAHVLARLEVETFTASTLRDLHQEVTGDGLKASSAIARLHRLVELHDWQHNQFFAPVAACLLWGTHLAWAIERWRSVHGPRVGAWLAAVGQLEALSSLSAYRYEHPDDVFPTVLPLDSAVRDHGDFEGTALAHPLIASAHAVRNDVRLAGDVRLLIISGSNMSGKSTLLRTVDINTLLALAGAPVRAASLRLTPLAIGATLRVQDSLQEGRSRFFAEITRIRQIADAAAGQVPVLFLLDELLQGTNSHDRLVGSIGVLKALLGRGAIGLVTTHDLAVTSVAGDLAPHALNAHFEDVLENGEMRFDYRLKPGPVTRSNAIALMRAIGLDVT
jgi:DNA mismatch repair ATPase MutS